MGMILKQRSPKFNLYVLAAGKGISDIGNFLNMVAFNLYILFLTDSALIMGLFMAIRLFGGFFCGFFSGMLADRMDRKTLMISSDLIRCLALILLVLAPDTWQLALLMITSFLLGAFGQVFNISLQSSIPVIFGQEHRVKANAVLNALQSIGMVIGTLTASLIIALWGYKTVFLIDALTFLISGLVLAILPIQTKAETKSPQETTAKDTGFFMEIKILSRYLGALPILSSLMMIRLIDTFGSASHNVGIPVFSDQLSPENPSFYVGLIWATWAVGNLIGSRGTIKWFKTNKTIISEIAFIISTFLMSAFFILLFWGEHWLTILPFALLAGVADGVSAICFNSRLRT